MNDISSIGKRSGTITVVLLSFLLFYFPSVLAIFSHGDEPRMWIVTSIVMATFYSAIFCINYFRLVPVFLIKSDRKGLYVVANLCIIIAICTLIALWFETQGGLPGPKHRKAVDLTAAQFLMNYLKFVIRDGVMMVLAAGLAYAMRLSQERENVRRRQLELNAEQRQIELKSLKAQLNPHFLFNSLNNIYALIGFAPEQAQEALHELSGMLRFMIYDSGEASVPLQKEVNFIRNYVKLMKLRLSKEVDVKCETVMEYPGELHIAPLLFLTLVENAFKHSGPNGVCNFISIRITTGEGYLTGIVKNSYPVMDCGITDSDNRKTGVGLENVRRQLTLLYADKYSLQTNALNGIFTAEIKIAIEALENGVVSASRMPSGEVSGI